MEAAGVERPLTHREAEILKLAASGLTHKEIAYQLGISAKTVRNHMANLYEKLNIHARAHAGVWAQPPGSARGLTKSWVGGRRGPVRSRVATTQGGWAEPLAARHRRALS